MRGENMRTLQQHAKRQEPSIHAGYSQILAFSSYSICSTCQLISAKTGE